ncbi:L-rhamnose-binding lectin CSL1-like isoform X2 [Xyrauchen texanus]|uniref:L-rhamnose-binding lectin CSL1-like isoform X2 n=1 Tax=Xyrauchen texanus TaxID=154827 RepID=UPI002242C4CE|nr:L-rhamnose-binding lectin CSL1-like isoform X2 [Xyrauchen texanus]
MSTEHGIINVITANYGRTDRTTCSAGKNSVELSNVQCTQDKSINVVSSQCEGKDNCSLPVNITVFGEPCPGTFKYLKVSYICFPKIKEHVTCEGNTASFNCDQGIIKVLASKFGNTNSTNCSAGIDPPDFSNVNCTQNTSISLVANRCDGNQNCSILVENSTFGDVCPGFYKYLKVSYVCLYPKELVPCSEKTTSLTCDDFYPGTLKVLAANYGCTASSTWSDFEDYGMKYYIEKCDSKLKCFFGEGNSKYCSNRNECLTVSYTCVPATKSVTFQNRNSTIGCEEDRTIYIHNANYGLRDATSSFCYSPQSKTLKLLCNGKKTCNLYASSLLFLDWCPNIYKTLEVLYSCVKGYDHHHGHNYDD